MGKPGLLKAGHLTFKSKEHTRGSETSQYPEEKKLIQVFPK